MPNKVVPRYIHSRNSHLHDLEKIALEMREMVIQTLLEAKSGHTGGALGTADIFAALYFHLLDIDPKDPYNPKRDRFVLSNGHICAILYVALAKRGFFDVGHLKTFRQINSQLQGHPHYNSLPGIETSSGPLGQGLSQAIGMALASRLDELDNRIYCMTGDGEMDEGQIWEAAMFAGKYKLSNLTWIIDRNNIQIDGFTEDVMPLESLRSKLEAFNWYVLEVDGHNIEEFINACFMAKSIMQRPSVIIAHTTPGKGVDFMENKYEWHGKPPNKEEALLALKELRTLEGQLDLED